MTGPQHYAQAELLLNKLPSHGANVETGLDRAETLAAAQVHATLSLAAATAEVRCTSPQQQWGGTDNFSASASEWAEVIG